MGHESKLNPFARNTTVQTPPNVRDIFGRVLQEGDKIYLQTAVPPPFVITQIQPVVDPSVPPNFMDVTVTCQLRFRAPRDLPNQEFTRIISAQEFPPAEKPDGPAGIALVTEKEPS